MTESSTANQDPLPAGDLPAAGLDAAPFWSWFSDNAGDIAKRLEDDGPAALREAAERVQQLAPGLACEIMFDPTAKEFTLVISAGGDPRRIDAVREVVAAAPEVPGWRVTAFRPRGQLEGVGIGFGDDQLQAAAVHFRASASLHGQLALHLAIEGLTQGDNNRANAAAMLMDHAIGELDSMTMISALSIGPVPDDDEAKAELAPLAKLPEFLDQVKDQGVNRWETYVSDLDGEGTPAAIVVKLGLAAHAPQAMRPWLLRVRVPLNKAREDGLLADEGEVERLWKLEEGLVKALEAEGASLFVGRMTTLGKRIFAFYAPTEKGLAERAEKVLADFPDYSPQVNVTEQPGWDFFIDQLVPDSVELLSVLNRHQVAHLESLGEKLDEAREVEFQVVFDDEAGRDSFLGRLPAAGFTARPNPPPDPQTPGVAAHVVRTMDIQFPSVEDATGALLELIDDLEGQIGGWRSAGKN